MTDHHKVSYLHGVEQIGGLVTFCRPTENSSTYSDDTFRYTTKKTLIQK